MAFVSSLPVIRAQLSSDPLVCRRRARWARMTIAAPSPSSTPASSDPAMASASRTLSPETGAQSHVDAIQEPVGSVSGTEQFLEVLSTSENRLVIIQVKAPWCRSCKALEPKVRRLAREFSQVGFYQMNYEDAANKPICFRLGVSSMPTFFLYYGAAGQIDKFTCGPNRAHILREKIEQFLNGECQYEPENSQEPLQQPTM